MPSIHPLSSHCHVISRLALTHPCCNILRNRYVLPHGLKHTRKGASCNRTYVAITRALQLDNRELLVGDCVSLVSFALYKQIAAIVFLPSFPGWLAPLSFNPLRFIEFGAFAATLCGTWVACATILGGYKMAATSGMGVAERVHVAQKTQPHTHTHPSPPHTQTYPLRCERCVLFGSSANQ